MKTITYNKLVRDKIPEIITTSGQTCTTEILSYNDYMNTLDEKLCEEFKEYRESKDIEELADMLEVIYAIAKTKGVSRMQLEEIRQQKAKQRGGFENRVFLKEIKERW